MKRKKLWFARGVALAVAVSAIFLMAVGVQAQTTLATWTFESSLPTGAGSAPTNAPLLAEGGAQAGVAPGTGSHASATTAWSNPAGPQTLHSFSSTSWAVGDYLQFRVSTVGYQQIMVDWYQGSSNTGPGTVGLFWSNDNVTYTQFGGDMAVLANAAPNLTWNTALTNAQAAPYHMSQDLTSLDGSVNNQPTLYLRVRDQNTTSANGGVVATGGTDRVDTFNVVGTPIVVPEPTSVALAGLGVVALCGYGWRGRRRRNRS